MEINEQLIQAVTKAVLEQLKRQDSTPSGEIPLQGRTRMRPKHSYAGYPKAVKSTDPKEIVIGVGINESKRSLFSHEERVQAIREHYRNEPKVRVVSYNDLTIDLARREGAKFILRGLRSVKDFEYERDIANMNHRLSGIETILLFTEPQFSSISSSVVRELIAFGKDVTEFLP